VHFDARARGQARIWDERDGALFDRLRLAAGMFMAEIALLCDQRCVRASELSLFLALPPPPPAPIFPVSREAHNLSPTGANLDAMCALSLRLSRILSHALVPTDHSLRQLHFLPPSLPLPPPCSH
jgi:hypothetical protein